MVEPAVGHVSAASGLFAHSVVTLPQPVMQRDGGGGDGGGEGLGGGNGGGLGGGEGGGEGGGGLGGGLGGGGLGGGGLGGSGITVAAKAAACTAQRKVRFPSDVFKLDMRHNKTICTW